MPPSNVSARRDLQTPHLADIPVTENSKKRSLERACHSKRVLRAVISSKFTTGHWQRISNHWMLLEVSTPLLYLKTAETH